jgi:DeoR/GlpR family transcriptional regulator of sugar metabolism
MKIFISHSSRQKLFVRELRRRLPDIVDLWIDEREILIGDTIDSRLDDAIHRSCDLLLLVIDTTAAKSAWVKKEIQWALERERELSRPFLLPIVLERDAWEGLLDESLRSRKYLTCLDFSENALSAFASSLVSELFAWLVRERTPHQLPQSPVASLVAADGLAASLAMRLRTIIHPHRVDNPLMIEDLAAQLRLQPDLSKMDVAATIELVTRLRDAHLLGGVFCDGEFIYLAKERYSYKADLFAGAKRLIAKAACRMVRSGQRVGIDGGSTALQMAMHLAEQIRAQALGELEVYTNSLPVASHLLDMLSGLEAGDRDAACRITLMGGWCRPVSLSVVPIPSQDGSVGETHVCPAPARLDIAFLGTNGLFGCEGFGLMNKYEVPAKRALIEAAHHRVILADPSKFLVHQGIPFAYFNEGLEILTATAETLADAIAAVQRMLEGTSSKMKVC